MAATGSGLYWIEHLVRQSADQSRKDEYSNVVYSCSYCNNARGAAPESSPDGSARLLDPSLDAWSDHFALDGHKLVPLTPDAVYTESAYAPNDDRKVEYRRQRADLKTYLDFVLEGPAIVDLLLDKGQVDRAMKTRRMHQAVAQTLRRFAAIPADAPATCRCKTDNRRRLRPEFDDGWIEVDI